MAHVIEQVMDQNVTTWEKKKRKNKKRNTELKPWSFLGDQLSSTSKDDVTYASDTVGPGILQELKKRQCLPFFHPRDLQSIL